MHDFFPLFAQAGVVAFQAVWLSVAVYDNITHSAVNERGFGLVLRMDLVEKQDPEAFKELSERRVQNPATEKALFKALVTGEATVAVLLWLGALALLLAALGVIGHTGARALAMMAVLGFTAIWTSLLAGGLWFLDRVGMANAVMGHSFLLIWGTVTLVFLAVAP
jgi:predicted small integral membrane protein